MLEHWSQPLIEAAWGCAAMSLVCWLLSVSTREYSWVDRLWSVLPPLYALWFASRAHFASARLDLMLALITLWGARLTYNFARKGGYRRGGEDYRWPELRRRLGPVRFQLFNATFIAPYQNVLLFLIALPAGVALEHPRPLTALDALAAVAFLAFLSGETIADQQQWNFQTAKQARIRRGESPGPGFLDTGLFRYSRHPNFFCEVSQWWCVYAFAVISSGTWWNVGLIGPVLLTLLFQGSTKFTEELSRGKYPEYAEYQQRTSRLVPWPARGQTNQEQL